MTNGFLVTRLGGESIASIIASLDLQETDRVLSVCSSGDVPFALLEHVSEVHAVDVLSDQVDYARARAQACRDGDHATFVRYQEEIGYMPEHVRLSLGLSISEATSNVRHMKDRGRFVHLASRLDNLHLYVMDLREETPPGMFSKAYLSNVLDHCRGDDYRRITAGVDRVLLPGALAYVCFLVPSWAPSSIGSLTLDEERTAIAQSRRSNLHPFVYKKPK